MFEHIYKKFFAKKDRNIKQRIRDRSFLDTISQIPRDKRFPVFVKYCHLLSDELYWEALGDIWNASYHRNENLAYWIKLFKSPRPERQKLMKPLEFELYWDLPSDVQLYRTVDEERLFMDELTWYIDRYAAERRQSRYRGKIVSKCVFREDIIALFFRRGDYEVVVLPY